jgi:CHASE2 domain-containing sensor protein
MNIKQVAKEILDDWKNPYFGAVPYLEAMLTMNDINENYYDDSGKSIVMYFLGNAQTWRGAKAKETKLLLNKLIK